MEDSNKHTEEWFWSGNTLMRKVPSKMASEIVFDCPDPVFAPTGEQKEIISRAPSLLEEVQRLKEQLKGADVDVPEWIINYALRGYHSSAGRAIRELIQINKNTRLLYNDTISRSVLKDERLTAAESIAGELARLLKESLPKVEHCYSQSINAAAHQEFLAEDRQLMYEIRTALSKYNNTLKK